jgi:hypothetical protein
MLTLKLSAANGHLRLYWSSHGQAVTVPATSYPVGGGGCGVEHALHTRHIGASISVGANPDRLRILEA